MSNKKPASHVNFTCNPASGIIPTITRNNAIGLVYFSIIRPLLADKEGN